MTRRPPVTIAEALTKRPEVRVRECEVRAVSMGMVDVVPVDGTTIIHNALVVGAARPKVGDRVLIQTVRNRQQVISSAWKDELDAVEAKKKKRWSGGGTGAGAASYPPRAIFTYTVRAAKDTSGVVKYYIQCDGSPSWTQHGKANTLAYNWTTNKGIVGTGVLFNMELTDADIIPLPEVTLTVWDEGGHDDVVVVQVVMGVTGRQLYVAAGSQAEASLDGLSWNTWTPGSGTVVSTAPECYTGGLFGLSNGDLYHTADCLATDPVLVHSFGSKINTIWANEIDMSRAVVGLEDGTIWNTNDLADLGASGWVQVASFADPIHWIVESWMQRGQMWVCSGLYLYITYDSFVSYVTQTAFYGTARCMAMSNFGNYVCADASSIATPDYSNPYGSEDRRSLITVSTTITYGITAGHNLQDMVRGGDWIPALWFTGSLAGKYLRFDFGSAPQLVTQVHGYNWFFGLLQGTWQWQGSNDGSSWTNIGAQFTESASNDFFLGDLSGNTAYYRYYQMLGISGTATGLEEEPSLVGVNFRTAGIIDTTVVKSVDTGGFKLTQPTNVRAITHGIKDATLWAADESSNFFEMTDGAKTMSLVSNLGFGLVYNMYRDGYDRGTIYLASANGLYLTLDMGRNWTQLRDYTGSGLNGLMVGYGMIGSPALSPVTVYSSPSIADANVKAKSLWNGGGNDAPPDGWKITGFTDTSWGSAVTAAMTGDPIAEDSAAIPIWSSEIPVANGEQCLVRQKFTIGPGEITAAALLVNAFNTGSIWINEHLITDTLAGAGEQTITVDLAALQTGPNVITAMGESNGIVNAWVAWKLSIT